MLKNHLMESKIKVVNPEIKYKRVSLIEPSSSHYLLIAAEIDHSILPFFIRSSSKKKAFIEQAKNWCRQLNREDEILSAVVFKANIISPGKGKLLKERPGKVKVAKYDVVILIEATSLAKLNDIKNNNGYSKITGILTKIAKQTYTTVATNIKQINAVDHKKQGVFLFNFFYADHLTKNLQIWEYSAGWFQEETGLNNSTVLLPEEGDSSYKIINHCRWDNLSDILPSLLFKRSFRSYVLDNFYANQVAAMPVLYSMA